jgi:hypothetical protein
MCYSNWGMLKRRPDLRRDISYRWPDSTPKSSLSTKLQEAVHITYHTINHDEC